MSTRELAGMLTDVLADAERYAADVRPFTGRASAQQLDDEYDECLRVRSADAGARAAHAAADDAVIPALRAFLGH
jgi:hypothetical protein